MSNIRIKWVGRVDEIQKHLRLFRVMWERGQPGDGFGYSTKIAIGLLPRFFNFRRDAKFDVECTLLGIRFHYSRSYGGIFA